jgi:ABC-type Mn2+/Zn2+ transport system ATPase subunit
MHHSLKVIDLHVRLGHRDVLRGVHIDAAPEEFVSIIGENGSGKTTLLKVIDGMIKPFQGHILIFSHDLFEHKNSSSLRKEIGFVPQKTLNQRFPMRVEEAVLMGRYGKIGLARRPRKEDRDKALDAMEAVGLRGFAGKLVHELSGGEQQKVALARALAQEPLLLLLDEPTTYLDRSSQSEIMETLHRVHHQRRLTTLLVSHDHRLVEQYSDKVYRLEDGKSSLVQGEG